MSNQADHSEHDSYEKRQEKTNVIVLNERRRAALAEIDNAPFSYALSLSSSVPSLTSVGGSTSKSVWLQVSAFSPMRESRSLFPHLTT